MSPTSRIRPTPKRMFAVAAGIMIIWVIISHNSFVDQTETIADKRNIKKLEERIEKLQRALDSQFAESKTLLAQINSLNKNNVNKILDNAGDNIEGIFNGPENAVLPVLVISCDRITVKRCLDNLVKFRPNKEKFPIIVSQDCGHNVTYEVIKRFTETDSSITVVRQPDLSDIPLPRSDAKFKGYYKIARHFKFALNHVFKNLGHEAVIIIEDDLEVSPDIFEYFQGTYPLLLKDPTLWCISAWNDNGKKTLIDITRPDLLYRTDFFPGLGWLLRKESWFKLEQNWPRAFFDDWLRNPANVGGRACIRPEISRTYSFGKVGVSNGLYFDNHLRHVYLNSEYVEFTKLNLTYLLKENYDKAFEERVRSLPALSAEEVMKLPVDEHSKAVRVQYANVKSYQKAAKRLGLMDDFRSGVPRAAYRGIVTCYVRGRRVYLAPDFHWEKYDPAWG